MKRYVTEVANEFLNVKKFPEDKKQKINQVIEYTKRGMITSIEAVQTILKIACESEN